MHLPVRARLHTGSALHQLQGKLQLGLLSRQQCCQKSRRRHYGNTARCSSTDEVLRSMSENGEVSILVVKGTDLVSEACTRHRTAPTASAALGRALMGTLLMGCFRAEGDATQVTFKGDGILGGMQVIADAHGNVKGKVGNPSADPPLRPDGKLNVGAAVGRGILAVIRSNKAQDKPYMGLTEIKSGEVAEDLAAYLVDSEQISSALALGVSIHRDSAVRAAGGYLIQVLPLASEETLSRLEQNIERCGAVTDMLHEGCTPRDITERLLQGLGVSDGGFSLRPRYGPCEAESLKERMKRAVALLGEKEVHSIMRQEGKIEVSCDFCRETYTFGEQEVLNALPADARHRSAT